LSNFSYQPSLRVSNKMVTPDKQTKLLVIANWSNWQCLGSSEKEDEW